MLSPDPQPLQVQLGVKGKQVITLFNDEHIPFHYSLDRSSYDATDELVASTGKKPALEITPVSGSIPPNSKVGGGMSSHLHRGNLH